VRVAEEVVLAVVRARPAVYDPQIAGLTRQRRSITRQVSRRGVVLILSF